uniref:Uncharacterized protein n=1 Tax=Oryza glumipatula TaxID=40148 RepID=A0A0E0AY72_9ORYZ
MVCTLHHRGLTPHLTSLHHQGTRATSIRASNLTTRRRRRRHHRHMTTATTTVVMRVLELGFSKDGFLSRGLLLLYNSQIVTDQINVVCDTNQSGFVV